jgi:hypothetical protein
MTKRKHPKLRDKDLQKIKVQGLKEFFSFSATQPLRKRIKFAYRILLKRI